MNDKTITISLSGYNQKSKEYELKQSVMLDFQPTYDDLADIVSLFHAYKIQYSRRDNPCNIVVSQNDFGKRTENKVLKDIEAIQNDDQCYLKYIEDAVEDVAVEDKKTLQEIYKDIDVDKVVKKIKKEIKKEK